MTSSLSGSRVLIVEDEALVSWLLEDMLTFLECEIVGTAFQLAEAQAIIDSETAIDFVVLDVNLNGEKSYPLADALVRRGVPFVFSTGYNSDNMPPTYRNIPVLQKPYTAQDLAAVISRNTVHGVRENE